MAILVCSRADPAITLSLSPLGNEETEQKHILWAGEKINKNLSASFHNLSSQLGGVGGYINKSINIIGHIPVFLSLTLNLNL